MKILFVCKGNMFRSQMAEAIAAKMIGNENVRSSGTYTGAPDEPEGQILKNLPYLEKYLEFMKTKGFNLDENKTKRLTQEDIDWADGIIDMAEAPYNSALLASNLKVLAHWDIENVSGTSESKSAEIYSILNEKITDLLQVDLEKTS